MTMAAEFRAKADECEKKAKEAKDAEAKRVLREAAQEWRTLADHAESGALVSRRLTEPHLSH
jgi:hypothetical protein